MAIGSDVSRPPAVDGVSTSAVIAVLAIVSVGAVPMATVTASTEATGSDAETPDSAKPGMMIRPPHVIGGPSSSVIVPFCVRLGPP